jgi:hypothetical protein
MDEVANNARPSQKILTESREVSVNDRLSEISSSVKVLQAALARISERVPAFEELSMST